MPATADKEQIEKRVIESLESFGADRDEITRDARFEELDVDSLDLVELAQIVEDEYQVKITEEDMKDLTTVGQAMDLVAERASG